MEKTRIVIVADGLDLKQIIAVLLSTGVAAQNVHLTKIQATPELRDLGVVFDVPKGQLVLSSSDSVILSYMCV